MKEVRRPIKVKEGALYSLNNNGYQRNIEGDEQFIQDQYTTALREENRQ
jgi:hypothetical protein